MANWICTLPLAVRSVSLFLFFLLAGQVALSAQKIYGLSGNNLVAFSATSPGTLQSSVALSGVPANQNIVGLDFRPNTGQLYALGYQQSTGESRLYTIQPATGVATPIGAAPMMLKPNMGRVSMDFNPTVDRIRVTGSNNANYRLHPVTGALVATDGDLAFAPTDVNAGVNPAIGAVAYTNSYIGSTSTTLYNYDDSLNVITTQIPPNNGVLNTIGNAGIQVNVNNPMSDFDIYFDAVSGMNWAYLIANTGNQMSARLFSINLSTGAATQVGMVGNGMMLSNIAVLIERNVPPTASGRLVYALAANNNLISFDASLPGVVRTLVPVSGIVTGQVLAGMDFRPATGELFALGYNSTSGEARLYTIDPTSGVATPIGAMPMSLSTNMGKISLDFNPTVDRIRVTGSNNVNYRLHPVTGMLAATDGNLSFATGDANNGKNPSIGAGAYTNSFPGATSTTLYNIEDSLGVLTTQIPPNNGVLNTVGSLGLMINQADPSTDLDIAFSQYGNPNTAYLVANVGTSTFDNLYKVQLTSGATTLIGKIGNGIAITDIAIALQPLETGCDVKTVDCVKFELMDVSENAGGDKTYRISVTNNCTDGLVYAIFQLPKGVTAEAPAHQTVFNSIGEHAYEVRNPNFSPFYSVRFKEMQPGGGIANGQSDLFEYTLPSIASVNYIHAAVRLGSSWREVYLNVFDCDDDASAGPEDRVGEEIIIFGNEEVRVYPNPSAGSFYVDINGWPAQELRLTLRDVHGRNLMQETVFGNSLAHAVQLPAGIDNGMYFLEITPTVGNGVIKKVMIRQ